MNDMFTFFPNRRPGTLLHLGVMGVLFLAGLLGLWQAGLASGAWGLLLYVLSSGILALIPLLAYWLYGLRTAAYSVARDGMRLRWGLRVQVLSIDEILWVRPVHELEQSLPLPRLHWPGALVGKRALPDGSQVEYLAAGSDGLRVVATPNYGYAISPADPAAFLLAYQHSTEMGSLSPWAEQAIYPTFLLARVWQARPARFLVFAHGLLSLLLLAWVGVVNQTSPQVVLAGNAFGKAGQSVPSAQLMLLPVLNGLFFLADLFLGLFFFRHVESRPYAYLVWAGGVLTAALFILAMGFIL
jgi:hypothetical protein